MDESQKGRTSLVEPAGGVEPVELVGSARPVRDAPEDEGSSLNIER